MLRRVSGPWLPLLAVVVVTTLSSCGGEGPTDPVDALALPDDQPLAAVLPDLAPEPGTAATERYVPTLHRVLRRAVAVIKEKKGDEAAATVVAEVQRLQAELRAAKEAGDKAAFKAAYQKMDGFAAQVGLRVFGPRLAAHVAKGASEELQALMPRLRAAAEAGHDVGKLVQGAQGARKSLAAAREAFDNDRPVVGLVLAARALDAATKISAMVPTS